MNALSREPTRAGFLAAFAVAVLMRLGVHVDPLAELAIDFGSLWFCAELTRRFTTPFHKPRAAAFPAPKEHSRMTFQEWIDAAKAKVEQLAQDAAQLWAAVPAEFQHPALDAVKAGVDDLAGLAKTEVEKAAPADVASVFDGLIASAQAAADAQIESINAATAAKVQSLQDAKAAAASVPA